MFIGMLAFVRMNTVNQYINKYINNNKCSYRKQQGKLKQNGHKSAFKILHLLDLPLKLCYMELFILFQCFSYHER